MAMTYIMTSRGGDPGGGVRGEGVPPAVGGPWCGIALQRYLHLLILLYANTSYFFIWYGALYMGLSRLFRNILKHQ